MLNSGFEHREQLGPAAAGQRALDWLSARRGGPASPDWEARFAAGQVLLDGERTTPTQVLRAGQWLAWRRPPWEEPQVPLWFEVVHLDDDLLAVAKPSGLPTLPRGGVFQDHTLLALLRARFPEATPLHRLGRHTSGLLLCARTAAARSAAAKALEQAEVRKIYRALASGTMIQGGLVIEAPIGKIDYPPLGRLHAAAAGGRRARSLVTVLERRQPDATLIDVEIETGRPHQIRIHLAWAGHPLQGDPLYGPGGVPRPGCTAVPGDGGYLLHAARLLLRHPRSGEPLDLRSPPPEALAAAAPVRDEQDG